MSNIDEIWASMNESSGMKPKVAKKKSKKDESGTVIVGAKKVVSTKTMITYEDMMKSKLNRDVNSANEKDVAERKRAMKNIHKALFEDYDMTNEDYGKVFRDIGKTIFKRFADPVEKCRELSQKITEGFFSRCYDFSSVLGYYFPALMQRLPPGLAYDDEMKVFVVDMENHEAYRRGKAVDRQDKEGTVGAITHQVVEPSEEIRLATCSTLFALIKQTREIGNSTVLHAYFQDMIMFLQAQLRDPCPDVKVVALNALEMLALIDDFEVGMKLYAVGLVRGILPVLRHRHSKVRLAAITALRFVMIVPDRAKRKASGSDAIPDMVGFKEENVLQVAAFYKTEVQVNYLAEIVNDKSVHVREKLVEFLTDLLTTIGDRYDHQTRLLPYLLDLLTDEAESVSSAALACLVTCGKQYEEDHPDEIIERRQYGIDGDDRINLDKPFPVPFRERPRLGIRLYARGNTKRFLSALVNELTNWVSTTRLKSAQLLKVITVLCEEHLTMEIHTLLPSLIKALRFARDDKDTALHSVLLEVFELLGRYVQPEVYIHYLLPRLRGDVDIVQFGVDAETRITAMEFLQALLEGSKPKLLPPFFEEIVDVLTDPYHISPDSVKLQHSALDVLITLLRAMKGKGHAVVEGHFVATGRLTNLKNTIRKVFRFLLLNLSHAELHQKANTAMLALCDLESDTGTIAGAPTDPRFVDARSCWNGVMMLFHTHGLSLLRDLVSRYELDSSWSAGSPDHVIMSRLVECPVYVVQSDPQALSLLLDFLCSQVRASVDYFQQCGDQEVEEEGLCAFSDLLVSLLQPIYCSHSFQTSKSFLYRCSTSIAPPTALGAVSSSSAHSVPFVIGQLGVAAAASEAVAAQAALQVVGPDESSGRLTIIMREFVQDLRWNRTVKLQQQRLRLLSALLGSAESDSGEQEQEDDEYVVVDGQEQQQQHQMRHYAAPVAPLRHLAAKALSGFDFSGLLLTAAAPANPVDLRVSALDFTYSWLRLLSRAGQPAAASTSSATMMIKVKSFRKQKAERASPLQTETVVRLKLSASRLISALLSVLDDSEDAVRVAALEALNCSVGLILSDEEVEYVDTHPNLRNGSSSSSSESIAPSAASYEGVIAKLLSQLTISVTENGGDKEEDGSFLSQLHDTLRLVAILDPSVFESQVRKEVTRVGGTSGSDRLMEELSGLVNHVDILKQFEK